MPDGPLRSLPSPFDGFRGMGRRGGAPSLSDQVQAILAGSLGGAGDPFDKATMHQDIARTVPVAIATDQIGNIRTKFGTTAYDIQQSNGGSRPAFDGVAGMFFDNSDDSLNFPLAIFQGVPAAFFSFRYNPASIGSDSLIFVSTGAAGNQHRFDGLLQADGSYRFGGRRLDADGLSSVTSAAGSIVTGTPYVISQLVDYAGGTITGWINGVQVASGALAGTPGNSENTPSLAATFGRLGATRAHGLLGRFSFCPFAPTTPQRLTIEAWEAETAL